MKIMRFVLISDDTYMDMTFYGRTITVEVHVPLQKYTCAERMSIRNMWRFKHVEFMMNAFTPCQHGEIMLRSDSWLPRFLRYTCVNIILSG